jgi:hypothetical protein
MVCILIFALVIAFTVTRRRYVRAAMSFFRLSFEFEATDRRESRCENRANRS